MGEEVKTVGVPIYTDARLYSTAGVPTVLYGAGPHTLLEANGHRADEKLKLDDLQKATRVVAMALLELLGA
jgi:acetylornithine deacetylase/succinyl-diaminopimelate desuccinylase-like protein